MHPSTSMRIKAGRTSFSFFLHSITIIAYGTGFNIIADLISSAPSVIPNKELKILPEI